MGTSTLCLVVMLTAPGLTWAGQPDPIGLAKVQGRVLDAATKLPLPGARLSVALLGEEVFVHSDDQGRYSLVLPMGEWTLVCSVMGIRPTGQTLSLRAGQALNLDLPLDTTPYLAPLPYVVQGRRLGLPSETKAKLNAPLVRELTKEEKKWAPVVKAGSRITMWTIWALIALSALGVITLHY